ncbi:ATP-binding protein [Kineococcus sp. SYSU DK005]|uniref:ATP-binding protein n=1 Tax=Kineococcus sp. SYSU DK005 TaxID=3383126 RepID=UPI003D7E658F
MLAPRLSSVPAARHWVAAAYARLTARGCCSPGVRTGLLELLTTEVVANAVLHGAGEVAVELSCEADALRVAVSDTGAGVPVVRRAGPSVVGGQGMALVDTLAARWGVRAGTGAEPDRGTGKTVWFELPART